MIRFKFCFCFFFVLYEVNIILLFNIYSFFESFFYTRFLKPYLWYLYYCILYTLSFVVIVACLCWAFAILIDVEGVGKTFFCWFFVLGTPITYPRGLIKGWLIYTRHFRAGPAGTSAAGCPQGEYIYLELVKYLNFNKMSFHPE